MTVKSAIVGYHKDDEDHWVAQLQCGHNQHVRHEAPWMERPWVLTDEGRTSMVGTELACVKCDRGEPRDGEAYVIFLENIPGTVTPRHVIAGHIEYLRQLDHSGLLLLGGPFSDHAGGMVVIRARDDAHAQSLVEQDPFVSEGVRKHHVRRWKLATKGNRYLEPV